MKFATHFILLGSFAVALRAANPVESTPLAPPIASKGGTLFVPVDAKESGVVTENAFSDPRLWDTLYQEWVYGGIGSGVAVGDFDNDGKPDLFVVSKCEKSRLFHNLGSWRFQDVTDEAGLVVPDDHAWQQGAAFADVNNDGFLDLYVCRFGAPNLLWINQGNGRFREEAAARGLALVDASGMAVFADYDRDGDLDVYIVTNMLDAAKSPEGQPDHLFQNDGNGKFREVSAEAGITGISLGHSAVWWDYDDDGWPDLYVSNDYKVPDRLYHNNRNGTFSDVINSTVPVMPYYSMGADQGDVNNDGRIDFLAADMAPSTREKDQRGFANSRTRAQLPPDSADHPYQVMRNVLYLGTDVGRFREAALLAGIAATDWTWSVRWEDLDNDGKLDLHVTNGMVREYHNADILAKLLGQEAPGASRQVMKASPVMAESDFAFRNLGDLAFEPVAKEWGLDHLGVSFGAAFADFDGDGDLDLVTSHYQEPATLLRNDGASGNRLLVSLRGTHSNRFGIGSRIDLVSKSGLQTRYVSPYRGYLSCSDTTIHFGLGADTEVSELRIRWPDGHCQVLTHLPANQHLTISEDAEIQCHPPALGAALFQRLPLAEPTAKNPRAKGATPQPFLPFDLDRTGPSLTVQATDAGAKWITGATSLTPRRVWQESSSTELELSPASSNDGPLLSFEANGDGYPDLLETHSGTARPAGSESYRIRLWLGRGDGGYDPAPDASMPNLSLSVGAVAVADWDHDGDLDLFVGGRVIPGRYPLPPRSVLLQNSSGMFADDTEVAPGLAEAGLVTSALWSDIDADGWVDLVVATEWGGVRCWKNVQGKRFEDQSEAWGFAHAGTGLWSSLAGADFNGDGLPDIVAGNVGLNTPYRGPAHLFYGDFKGGGSPPFLIEASEEAGQLYPRRTRSEIASRLPALTRQFPLNDVYARTSLGELVGPERLAAAKHFTATEFRSGIYYSQPGGKHTFVPFDREQQIAPIQGLATADLNGDGFADIFLGQNSFAPASLMGPFTGGLSQLLLGDGEGHFRALSPGSTGIVVTGDVKGAAVVADPATGRPNLLVTEGSGRTALFLIQASESGQWIRVRLKGPPGNPNGIGARLRLTGPGKPQTAEVTCGHGTMSEGDPSCFFGYKTGQRPTELTVNWPDGSESHHQVPTTGSIWVVTFGSN